MDSTPLPFDLAARQAMLPREVSALVHDARMLQRSAEAGATQPLLRGRRFGLLDAGDAARDEIALFDRAAMALGAQVAHIRPNLTERSGQREIEDTANMLGRLYDAVVCQGMASSLVRQLGAKAGIPVYDGIVSSIHPLAVAADQLDPSGSPSDRRLFLLQALLVRSLG